MASGYYVTGVDRVERNFDALVTKADIGARNIVEKGGIIVAGAAKTDFRARPAGSQTTSKRTGRIYYKGAPNYPANPPMPTNRSGNLRRSIKLQRVTTLGAGKWESTTGPSMLYAPFVEYGTSRARAFPYMRPALEKSMVPLRALYEMEWASAFL